MALTRIDVVLTDSEILSAGSIASQIILGNIGDDVEGRYGGPKEGPAADALNFMSAQAEQAVAAYLNLYWNGNVGIRGAVDVGGLVQVRSTDKPRGCLVLHPRDSDNEPFVLVISRGKLQRLVGWAWGWEAKRQEHWSDPTGKGRWAFFAPQTILRPIAELKDWVRDQRP